MFLRRRLSGVKLFGRKSTVAECRESMTEETQTVQETAQEEQRDQSQPVIEAQSQETSKEEPRADADHNWKQANEVLRIQKQEIEYLKAQMAQMAKPQEEPEKDEFADLDPEEYLTVDKARKMAEKLAEKKAAETAKKYVAEYVQQQNIQNDEARARSKYDDYDFVLENYALPLIKNDPALAYKVQTSKNPAETAYRLGKLSDSYEEGAMKQPVSPKAEKILKNASRPVSGNAVGNPLKTQADQFSKMSSQQVWEMSQKFARGA